MSDRKSWFNLMFPYPCDTETDLFIGRFQGVHKMHLEIMNLSSRVIVAVVHPGKPGKRRPFSKSTTQAMVSAVLPPHAELLMVDEGNLTGIARNLRLRGLELRHVYAGADRVGDYTAALESANSNLEAHKRLTAKVINASNLLEQPVKNKIRIFSGSNVRKSLMEQNLSEFMSLTPEPIHSMYEQLLQEINEKVAV